MCGVIVQEDGLMEQFVFYYQYSSGFLKIEGEGEGLTSINFSEKSGKAVGASPEILKQTIKQLDEYFNGERKEFTLRIKPEGTDFQKKVWSALSKIPFGQTSTYGRIADEIGHKNAARAVGGACNRNPFPIIIPCHRVLGANGSLTGFGGGMGIKKQLLDLEAGARM